MENGNRNHQQRTMDQYLTSFNNNQSMDRSRFVPVSSYPVASTSVYHTAVNQTPTRTSQNTFNQPATIAQAPLNNFANFQSWNRNNFNPQSISNQLAVAQPENSLNRSYFNPQNMLNKPSTSAHRTQNQSSFPNYQTAVDQTHTTRFYQNNDNSQNLFNPTSTTTGVVSFNENVSKRTPREKVRLLTGKLEKVIKWYKLYKESFCYYEVIAPIISIQEGTVRLQKVLLLRDKNGPILQVTYYINDHINIENFQIGQQLRCVGRMVGPNILHGLSIREATPGEVATLARMCYISEHAITKATSNMSSK